jgi:hypothetical protein
MHWLANRKSRLSWLATITEMQNELVSKQEKQNDWLADRKCRMKCMLSDDKGVDTNQIMVDS